MLGSCELQPVASKRNQHCGGETRPEGPKIEARRADPRVILTSSPPAKDRVWGLGKYTEHFGLKTVRTQDTSDLTF